MRETSNGNRRNVSLSGMLEWINWVARNPCGSMKGEGAKISKRSEEWFQECLNRANRAREVLYLRRQEYQYGDMVHAQFLKIAASIKDGHCSYRPGKPG